MKKDKKYMMAIEKIKEGIRFMNRTCTGFLEFETDDMKLEILLYNTLLKIIRNQIEADIQNIYKLAVQRKISTKADIKEMNKQEYGDLLKTYGGDEN